MTKCTLCHEKITTKNHSREHVIPQSIGGRLKVSGFICKRCNEQAGAEWDRPLFDQYQWFSVTLDIKRESGKSPGPIKVNTVDGRTFKLSSDGTMVPAIPTKPTLADDGKTISFSARDWKEARQQLSGLKRRFPQLDVDAVLGDAVETETMLDSPLIQSFEFGGVRELKSTVKTALAFAFKEKVDLRYCSAPIAYLNDQHTHGVAAMFYTRDPVVSRPSKTLSHIVGIQSDLTERRLLAYVEYFGVARFAVLLSEDYEGEPVHAAHAIDPTTGKEVQVSIDLKLSDDDLSAIKLGRPDFFDGFKRAMDDLTPLLMEKMADRRRERELTKIIQEGFAQSGAEPGSILNEQQFQRLSDYVSSEAAKLFVLGKR